METAPLPDVQLSHCADLATWRLVVEWPSLTYDFAPHHFIRQPEFSQSCVPVWDEGIRIRMNGRMIAHLDRASAPAQGLITTAEKQSADKPRVRLLLDETILFSGVLEEWREVNGELMLEARLPWPWNPEQLVCRDLGAVIEGVLSPAWAPQVFGRAAGVPAVALFPLMAVRALGPIARGAEVIYLNELPPWPVPGRIQVDDENISYAQILNNPPRLAALLRAFPRDHGSGKSVHPLPVSDPRWVAADHAAAIEAVRVGAKDGELLADYTTAGEEIDGRDATVITAPHLPVVRRISPFLNQTHMKPSAADWQIDLVSTVLLPEAAFEARANPGASFKHLRTLFRANWKNDLRRDVRRHDVLRGIHLNFEYNINSYWRRGTELRVRVSRGAKSREFRIDYPIAFDVAATFRGSATVENQNAGRRIIAAPGGRALIGFDNVAPNSVGEWSNSANVLEAGFATWTTRIETGGEAPLRLLLHRDHLGAGARIESIGLFARMRANQTTTARLRLYIPGKIAREQAFTIGTSWETYGEEHAAPGLEAEDLCSANAVYEIIIEEPSTVDVAAVWIELSLHAQELAGSEEEPLALKVIGEVAQSVPFMTVRIDFSELLADENDRGWHFFSQDGNEIILSMELFNASPFLILNIRNVHWEFETHPALSISAETKLFADVVGRVAEPDGSCRVENVLGELLLNDEFAAIGVESIDLEAMDDIAERAAHYQRRFRAAFYERIRVEQVILAALGECAALLAPRDGKWMVRSLETDSSIENPPALNEEEILEYPGELASSFPALRARRIEFVRRGAGEEIVRITRPIGSGVAEWNSIWLCSGFESMAEFAFRRLGILRHEIELPLHFGWLALQPGQLLALSLSSRNVANRRAMCGAREVKDARLSTRLELLAPRHVCWSAGGTIIWREFFPPRLVFYTGGRIVAEFSPGELRLRGQLREHVAVSPMANGAALREDGAIVLTAGVAALAFDVGGDLLIPADAIEGAASIAESPECFWRLDSGSLILGSPELGTVAVLAAEDERLRVKGRVRERWIY